MQSGLRSYLIPDGEAIWDSIQTATGPVDRLPDFTRKMADILSDYLSSERRINLPSANCGHAMENCVVLACMTPHEARTLRTRLGKKPAQPISAILDLYGITATGGTDDDELERLLLAHSPKFQALLDKSHRQVKATGGIPHEEFWQEVEAEIQETISPEKPVGRRTRRRA